MTPKGTAPARGSEAKPLDQAVSLIGEKLVQNLIALAHPENWDPQYADERRRLHQRLSAVMGQYSTRPPEIQWPAADAFAPDAPYKRKTKRLYARDVIIEAPVQTVWDTFTDLPRLGEWNPLLTAIEGELGLGQWLQVHIAAMPRPVEATVIRYNPPFELQWLDTIPGGMMTPRFGIKLEAVGENRTRFIVQESFEGPLVGIAGQRHNYDAPSPGRSARTTARPAGRASAAQRSLDADELLAPEHAETFKARLLAGESTVNRRWLEPTLGSYPLCYENRYFLCQTGNCLLTTLILHCIIYSVKYGGTDGTSQENQTRN